jgi:signal transduction histidine kinase
MRAGSITAVPRSLMKVLYAGILAAAVGFALWYASTHSYLLFHSVTEVFSIVIAASVFMISWNSRSYPGARPFVILGIGFLFVAFIDLFHTLSYRGMGVLPDGQDYATKLWVAGRAVQVTATVAFALLLRLRRTVPSAALFAFFAAMTAVLLLSIFVWNVFPLCLVEGQGVTPFKIASEYVLCAFLAVAIALVTGEREALSPQVRTLLVLSFAATILSEMVFTLYSSAYGTQNLIGHYLKIAACVFAYQALFSTEVRKRIAVIEALEQANEALARTERELRKANASKDKFFSIIAHDLRNPIGGLLTLSELLAKKFDAMEPQKVREFCRLIYDGTRQGSELLESLLQWARAQTGRIECEPRPLSLAALCRESVALFFAQAQQKEIRILCDVQDEMIAFADENMVFTILRNLLSNAVKFTSRGGCIGISAGTVGECVELSVADTGVGMSPEDLEKLFRIDVHFTCKGTANEHGNGLGLIVCGEFAEKNRGSISVKSRPGEGTTFTLRLPRAAQPMSSGGGGAPPSQTPSWLGSNGLP